MLIIKLHAAFVGEAMPLQVASLSTTTLAGWCTKWDTEFGVVAFIALVSSVEISFFVISTPCVVSTLSLFSWLEILAFTFTGTKLFTLPLATNIALLILVRIAFLITGSSCFIIIKLLPCIEFVV